MKLKGFILMEIIMGIFLVGIFVMMVSPLITFSFNNINRIKNRDEMNYIGEMVVEKVKSRQDQIMVYINKLETLDEITYIDDDFDSDKYFCKLIKKYSSGRFLELLVHVELKGGSEYVVFEASFSK